MRVNTWQRLRGWSDLTERRPVWIRLPHLHLCFNSFSVVPYPGVAVRQQPLEVTSPGFEIPL